MTKFTIITLFREAIEPYLKTSMMWKATEKGLAEFEFVNLREFGLGPHKSVDDTPYGGGDGMLLRCEPVFAAIESVKAKDPSAKVILPTPVGEIWDQQCAKALAQGFLGPLRSRLSLQGSLATLLPVSQMTSKTQSQAPSTVDGACDFSTGDAAWGGPAERSREVGEDAAAGPVESSSISQSPPAPHYIILCPHYEGYDERILSIVDYKISLGKYVLTGGELPALIIIDSIVRLIPGVLGGAQSAEIESFSNGNNLEYPQYTKPYDFRGMTVPDILLSGNHGEIAKWREEHSGKA
ncbi:tRNA (guanine(37)-N(1))-methyltransferase [Candidatus Saccharibacteria bacterium]|nr:tRNA (guanine(37)-N(1))-methyltransferase [Candidatus Saccharibacteria bacterium]